MIIGYTTGVFDLFHYGHVRLLRNAKSMCDKLIVGVSSDKLAQYKNKKTVIPFEQRIEVVRACRYVDVVIPQLSLDKLEAWDKLKFDIMFVGDDWYKTKRWQEIENNCVQHGVRIIYFPYTDGTSSTLINNTLKNMRGAE